MWVLLTVSSGLLVDSLKLYKHVILRGWSSMDNQLQSLAFFKAFTKGGASLYPDSAPDADDEQPPSPQSKQPGLYVRLRRAIISVLIRLRWLAKHKVKATS
jgi:hypothetical protein